MMPGFRPGPDPVGFVGPVEPNPSGGVVDPTGGVPRWNRDQILKSGPNRPLERTGPESVPARVPETSSGLLDGERVGPKT